MKRQHRRALTTVFIHTLAAFSAAFGIDRLALAEPPRDTSSIATSENARSLNSPDNEATGLIVKFSIGKSPVPQTAEARATMIVDALRDAPRKPSSVQFARTLASNAELHRFSANVNVQDAEMMARIVARMPGVEYAAPNRIIATQAIPTDPDFPSQWGFQYVPGSIEGANFTAAWDITKGSPSQTLGVVDSGIAKASEAFAGRIRTSPSFPNGGYDFITDPQGSGDNDGRDNDPEQVIGGNCVHGVHVAGTMVANTAFSGAGVGAAGGAPQSQILAGRALNFFGDDADAIDAMLWLSGAGAVDGNTNPYAVRVINMSFGGSGACGSAYQTAFDQLLSRGTLPVVAAGNSSIDVSTSAPANCRGAVAIAASDIAGNIAGFSNRGPGVTLTAPGVDIISVNGLGGSCSKSGTSMAAPHVSAAIALMQAANPALTNGQTVLGLRAGARAFPVTSNCTSVLCGAGLLDAFGAIQATQPSAPARVGWSNGAPVSVRENDGGVSLSLTRIGNTTASTSATVSVTNGTAISGVDFTAPFSTTVSWGANDVQDKTLNIPVIYRPGEQGARSFSVNIASVAPAAASGSIVAPNAVDVRITEVDCGTVAPIQFGETKTGNVGVAPNTYCRGGVRGPEFNTVRYSFTGTAGSYASVALTSTLVPVVPPATGAVLDTYVYLLDSNLQILTENDDIRAGVIRSSRITEFQLPTTGTYYIDVTTWSSTADNAGTYSLKLASCGLTYDPGPTCNLDADGDLVFDSRDAQMILRRLLGYSGAALTNGAAPFRACAQRVTDAAIGSFIDAQTQPTALSAGAKPLDIDGDDQVLATTDGLMLLRAALGLPGSAIIAGATAAGAPRATWAQVQPYLKNQCGLMIAP